MASRRPPGKQTITLPHNWAPRDYQSNFWNYLTSPSESKSKRAIVIWHRRSGKDETCLHFLACSAMRRVGSYLYMLPTNIQARRVLWQAVNPHTGNRRVFDAFIGLESNGGLIHRMVDDEMIIELVNGSTIQFCGSDNFNALVGSSPVGLIFSEWAICDPQAWAFLRPIVAENQGFAIFVTTPRGTNHAYEMYNAYRDDPDWFAELLPATDTGVFTPQALATERREYIAEHGEQQGDALFRQEYLCSFTAGLPGAYYANEIERAEQEGRVGNVPYDPRLPVHTSWDLGFSDSTAIWFFQMVGQELRAIDYLENSGVGLDWYVKELQKKNYVFGTHCLPHDVAVKELGTGRSRLETLRLLGMGGNIRIVPAQSIPDGINAVRTLLPSMWFDKVKTAKGLDALKKYHRSWDEKRKVFADRPYHDFTSHAADSMRYWAMANVRNAVKREIKYPTIHIP